MYNEHFGLEESPFSIAPDPRYLYMSEQHREALAHLVYGFNSNGGFVLLTGEVGTGKTTVCRCLLNQIPDNVAIAFVLNPKLTVQELLATICDEFGIGYPEDNSSVKVFVDLLNAYLLDAHGQGKKTVLIIDEAQNLDPDVLEQLRLLTNLETNQEKLLQIILIGQPELKDILSKPELRQLSQRVIARYHLGPLSKKEVGDYVAHRLSVAGIRDNLFPEAIINRIFRLSGGVPRLINVLCDRALLGTFTQNKNRVNSATLTKASKEVLGELPSKEQGHSRKAAPWMVSVILLIVVGVVLAASYYNDEIKESASSETIKSEAVEAVQLENLNWPDGLPAEHSREMAFQALFEQWEILYQPESAVPACNQAQKKGLKCYENLGSLSNLRSINRPVILKFYDTDTVYYAAMIVMKEDTAVVVVGNETREVSLDDIEDLWLGEYTLLWRPPPGYRGAIQPGSQDRVVQWLENQLAHIGENTTEPRQNMIYDDALLREVKKFQLSEGLIPEGVVGTQTLIHINSATESDIPLLIMKKEDS